MTTRTTAVRHRLVRHLLVLAGRDKNPPGEPDRAGLAALRRGLGKLPGTVPETWPQVEPYTGDVPRGVLPSRWEDACYMVAALFASHWEGEWSGPRGRVRSNLGASFRCLAEAQVEDAKKSVERRFLGLLRCGWEELHHHLRHAVSLLKAEPIPVDWDQLLDDIPWWDHPERRVQRNWGRTYWRQRSTDGEGAPQDQDET